MSHYPNFLKGKCDYCDIEMLMTCPIKEDKCLSKLMEWKCYELMVHGKIEVGMENKVLKL
jgi:hypothetical protein